MWKKNKLAYWMVSKIMMGISYISNAVCSSLMNITLNLHNIYL